MLLTFSDSVVPEISLALTAVVTSLTLVENPSLNTASTPTRKFPLAPVVISVMVGFTPLTVQVQKDQLSPSDASSLVAIHAVSISFLAVSASSLSFALTEM